MFSGGEVFARMGWGAARGRGVEGLREVKSERNLGPTTSSGA
jgi:hypothetical protein